MKGGEYYISKPRWSSGTIYAPDGPSSGLKEAFVSGNSKFTFLADDYEAAKLRWAGGAERPVWRCIEPKKTGARSARAHTRGQNPLVIYIHLGSSVCHPVCRPVILSSCHPVILSSCHSCGTLKYSLCLSNQTDQGDEREGFEREGYRWRNRRCRD